MAKALVCFNCGSYIHGLDSGEISDERWELLTEYQSVPRSCEQMILDGKFVCWYCIKWEEKNHAT